MKMFQSHHIQNACFNLALKHFADLGTYKDGIYLFANWWASCYGLLKSGWNPVATLKGKDENFCMWSWKNALAVSLSKRAC